MKEIRRTGRGVLLVITVLVALVFSTVTASAVTVPDPEAIGSITVSMKDPASGEAVPGGTLTLYKAGQVKVDDGNYSWELTNDFAGSGADLSDLGGEGLAQTLAGYAEAYGLKPLAEANITDAGNARIGDLGLGLYLIIQTVPAEGYEKVMPFLVTVPMQNGDAWIYDVDASPKVELIKAPTPTPTETVTPTPTETPTPTVTITPTITPAETLTPTPRPSRTVTPTPAKKSTITPAQRNTITPATRATVTPRITSRPSTTLPKTGQLWWPVPVLAAIGVIFVILGIKRRNK